MRTIEAATALVRHDAPTAVSAYEALVADFPAEAVFDADLARAYLLAGRLDDARRVNRKALELNPQYWPGHALEARAFARCRIDCQRTPMRLCGCVPLPLRRLVSS